MKKFLLLILIFCNTNKMTIAAPKTNLITKSISSNNPLKKIIKAIAKSNVYEIPRVNTTDGSTSRQNVQYEELLKIATVQELSDLATKNKNTIVRLYAFRALVAKQKDIPKNIIDLVLNDTETVNIKDGDKIAKAPLNSIAKGFLY